MAMQQHESCSSSTALDPAVQLKELKRQLRLQAQTMKNQIVTLATAISESIQAAPVTKPLPPPPTEKPTVVSKHTTQPPTLRPRRSAATRTYYFDDSPPLRPQKAKEEPPELVCAPSTPQFTPQRSPDTSTSDRPVRQRKEKRPFSLISELRLPEEMKRCQTVLAAIQRYKNAQPFMHPVDADALGIPDYYKVVAKPMDLGTVSENLAAGKYTTLQQIMDDVQLIWDNCRMYNGDLHPYSQWANELQEIFEKKMEPILQRYSEEEKERRRIEQHSKKYKREIEELEARIREIKENPKRRLELLAMETDGERPVMQEDKQKLRQLISTMDSCTCVKAFDLVKRDCPNAMVEKDDEVEVDLDVLDIKTFRALEKLVQAALRKRLNEAKKKKGNRGRPSGEEEEVAPVAAPVRGRRRKIGLQVSPHSATTPTAMPMGFEELPSEAAFGHVPSLYSDEESDHSAGSLGHVRLGAVPAVHISAAAARAGLTFESDGEEEDEEEEEDGC